ncbi:IQ-DOMAIN 14 protein [Nymphaea thermarum]|nr:IQ-DOMAIN 14 protein [Nymphaea thermarum]
MVKVGSSWLTAVKRAFRSPSKDSEKKSCRRRDDNEQEEEEKKREKRRWLFRKPAPSSQDVKPAVSVITDQRHAIAVAVATAAAAEAAVASAQAAVEVVRLTRPTNLLREHHAAVKIQTAFRGFLARRALRALRGLVKLQALVRGHNVRKQANMTLRCMQALVRVQTRARDQRLRLSHDSTESASLLKDGLWDSRFVLQESSTERKSVSRDGSCLTDNWDDRPHTIEEIQAKLQTRKEASLKREKALAYAFSHQLWRSSGRSSNPSTIEETDDERASGISSTNWLDRWMATRPWESRSRASVDSRDFIKTVEFDTTRPYSSSLNDSWQRSRRHANGGVGHSSPLNHRNIPSSLHLSPSRPSPAKARILQVRSASPRCSRAREDEVRHSVTYTPGLHCRHGGVPNYMAATESAKARLRSQSAPRQRPGTPEREKERERERERGSSVKKRLSYPAPDVQSLRSPSFKGAFPPPRSAMTHYSGSNYSWCTDSIAGGERSPSSAGDARRWLR